MEWGGGGGHGLRNNTALIHNSMQGPSSSLGTEGCQLAHLAQGGERLQMRHRHDGSQLGEGSAPEKTDFLVQGGASRRLFHITALRMKASLSHRSVNRVSPLGLSTL